MKRLMHKVYSMSASNIRTLVIVLTGSLCCVIAASSGATVLKQANLTQLTTKADLIFAGKVLAIDSQWDSSHSKIWTHVTFLVNEVIKGSSTQKEVTLKLPGGAIDAENIRMKVDGVPEFKVGEEVLIFCSHDPKRICPIVGWYQGQFKIKFNQELGEKVIEREKAARFLLKKRVLAKDKEPLPAITYREFVDEINRVMNQTATNPKPNGAFR